jgi:glutamine amidotransferase
MVTLGELPSREHLENACINNDDGFGWAVHHGDEIVTFRSMNSTDAIDSFYNQMSLSDNSAGMFHARITTHGSSMVENNHPFKVGGRNDIILGHNGMLPVFPKAGDVRSDTRIFAEEILPSIGVDALDDRQGWKMLEEFASGSKLAIFSTAPELRDGIYIVNEDLGSWDSKNGIWWSNSSYQYRWNYRTAYSGYYNTGSLWAEESTVLGHKKDDVIHDWNDNACTLCLSPLDEDNFNDGICYVCNSCLDCFEAAYQCLCYNPTSEVRNSADLVPMYKYNTLELEY